MNKKEEIAYRKKHKFVNRNAKGIHFDIRNKGCCFIKMKTNAGLLEVYIDSMDGLEDPPMVVATIAGRGGKEILLKGVI